MHDRVLVMFYLLKNTGILNVKNSQNSRLEACSEI